MTSVFLLSLNFNIWQSATKHICYSNIYTTYIAIYVTSQQSMVEKEKKQTIDNKNLQRNKRGSENYHKFWHGKSVHNSTVRWRWDCAIKKTGFRRDPTTKDMVPTVPVSSFLFFYCKMAYRYVSRNEVVHTSVLENLHFLFWWNSGLQQNKRMWKQ